VKLVEFAKDMAPHVKGETRLVPDLLAEILHANGDITDRILPWPAEPPPSDPTNRYLGRDKRPKRTR
jgi:hypothetical protein